MPFTFHSHSGQFCRHAKGTLEDVVRAAISRNMLVLGLSEHIPRSRMQDLYPEESDMTTADLHKAFRDYVAEARRLRDKYSSQISILIGAESEYITAGSLEDVKQLRRVYSLDYIVGSLHHVDEIPLDFSDELYQKIVDRCSGDRKEMFRRYFDAQLVMLKELQPEVVGHFDLVRIFHPYTEGAEDPLDLAEIRALASRNIDYAISYGALFEVNSRAWKKGLPQAYPQRDLLQEILEKGGRITISDDSHGEQDLGMHYDKLCSYLKEMGVGDLHYLERSPSGGVEAKVLRDAMDHPFWSLNGFCGV
ncbi:histidinol-phosphatase [Martensiomyces pterosporus]|nr:histidinol-phosphatase [Martensiomyces pterosporus]